jgi:hypothetical protein
VLGLVPFLFSIFKNIFFNNNKKRSLFRTILTTLGYRFVSPFIAQRVRGFFSKTKATIS